MGTDPRILILTGDPRLQLGCVCGNATRHQRFFLRGGFTPFLEGGPVLIVLDDLGRSPRPLLARPALGVNKGPRRLLGILHFDVFSAPRVNLGP